MNIALDTNILAYAEGVSDRQRHQTALDVIRRLPSDSVRLPVQALGELFQVLVIKAGYTPAEARSKVVSWADAYALAETSAAVLFDAMELAVTHRFFIWDAVVVCAAAAAGCRLLLSEDMQDGFTSGAITIVNPFAEARHPLLEALLASTS